MNIKDVLFPIKQSFEVLEHENELNRIKQKDAELAQRLKAEEQLESEYPMKRFSIEVISGGVILPYTIEARGFDYSGSGTYYFYTYKIGSHGYKEREIISHFPIDKTIIKNIEII
jgi:hypothetical protein